MKIHLTVNGTKHVVDIQPDWSLLEVLRDELGLTGAKEVCAEGECGACTVLVDGEPITSCLMLAAQAQGREILTVEGLASDNRLDPLQTAFMEVGAVQCGYCIPGMLMSARALLDRISQPTLEQIHEALAGNFCRCTGYAKIVEAIQKAAGETP